MENDNVNQKAVFGECKCLYIDLDDVVADWVTEAFTYLNQTYESGYRIPAADWDRLVQHKRFYKDLALLPGAKELVDWAKQYTQKHNMHLAFLTAIPCDNDVPYAIYDKVRWADKHFPGIPVFFGPYSFDKHMHCSLNDVLIDDRTSNCLEWRQAGGIAHQYTDWENCKKWIRSTLGDDII